MKIIDQQGGAASPPSLSENWVCSINRQTNSHKTKPRSAFLVVEIRLVERKFPFPFPVVHLQDHISVMFISTIS